MNNNNEKVPASAPATECPTVACGQITFNRADFASVWRDTPLNPPASSLLRGQFAPGTCVKSGPCGHELCGRVHNSEGPVCIVIGHGWENWDSERFVWRGSRSEFSALWEID